jgi:transposase
MTLPQPTPEPRVLVAMDVSKYRHDALIEAPGWRRPRRFTVPNQAGELRRFRDYLGSLAHPVHVAFEATGDYHRGLAYCLLEAGFRLHLVSALTLARTREALHNSWDKNDPRDAQVILHLLRAGQTQYYQDPLAAGINDFQELSKTHWQVSRQKTQTLHRLQTHFFPLYFPEIAPYLHSSRAEGILRLLQAFPTPGCICALSEEEFVRQGWPLIGRKVGKQRLLEGIYRAAQGSMGLPVAPDSEAVAMFRLVAGEMLALCQTRAGLEQRAEALLGGNADFQRLRQIPGIGPIGALTILAEAGDLRRFAHHRQFLKFCGFDLATNQSGQHRGLSHISKHGNARLRCVFWMAAQVAVRMKENSFRYKYERYLRGKPADADARRKACIAVAAKIARVAHGLIKTGADYRPFFEAAVPSGRTCSARAVEAHATS